MTPTKEQIKKFLDNLERLARFEGQHRYMRNWGAYTVEEIAQFPDQDILTVREWLEELSKE